MWLDAAGFKGHIAAVTEEDVAPAETQHETGKQRPEIRWGVVVSVLLHVPLVALLIFGLPKIEPKPAEEESVKVELVPPPEEKKPEEKPKEKPPEPKPPEQAKKQPPPPPPPPPPPKAAKPEPSTPMQSISRSVPEFADKDTTPGQREQALPRQAEAPKPPIPDVEPAKAPVEPQQSEKRDVPETMPEDIELPQVETAEVHPEKNEPAAVGLAEAKTNFEQAEHPKESASTPPVAAEANVKKSQELTEARTLYSEKATSDPRIKSAIKNLPRAARINVLCQTELQQQLLHAPGGYSPDFLPSFPRTRGNILNGTGGAFQSSGSWYDVTLICEVDSDARKVISFRFDVGDKIPKSQWKSRGF
ncbi:UNVERIFIED_ORG: hypothetical protein GGI57_004530 [Rhizobium aethiopicum]